MKYLLVGIFSVLLCAIIFAPASLIKQGFEANTTIRMTNVRGSLWHGSAKLGLPGSGQTAELGDLEWNFAPRGLLSLCITYDIHVRSGTDQFDGRVCRATKNVRIEGDLRLHSTNLNRVLKKYDINLSGVLELDALLLVFDPAVRLEGGLPQIADISAQMHWSGGPVQYRLSGINYALGLPALEGDLSFENNKTYMRVFEQGTSGITRGPNAQIALILGNLDQKGWVSVGITKKFTKLLNQPWPGSEPDHAVVLEVQEKLL